MNFVKNAAAGAVLGGSLLFTAGLGMAQAQPAETPDGLVSLSIGDVTLLETATADKAAAAAAAICGAVPADVSALVAQVDGEGTEQTVCSGLPGGDLVVAQNVATAPAETPAAPAQTPAPAEESAPEGESGTGAGLGAPEGTGAADDGSVPLPSDEG
ncbi:hypothetical protein JN086_07045 [Mycolicibacterium austroafricanum]|uniref:Secreted protein n=1 Tax=Mycolicibacterium austroafricanum TaxID=39687 RepID=A0ABT8H8B1_MYCAO|nr:hypothetical protein [Mycolicibacterium austroafricanum]MDN4517004.1 hypothetical protein [Mycolicibacterium austroafricanum]QRZ08097.1 hypothetical protein JN090_06045 [Mycolicibacterium austroafricanum]QZT69760.1 hypothetical protein JN086_07045 [Mycolicibacterium austroafricanum]